MVFLLYNFLSNYMSRTQFSKAHRRKNKIRSLNLSRATPKKRSEAFYLRVFYPDKYQHKAGRRIK